MEDKNYQEELGKVKDELEMFYDIGNAMRTTLNLEEILYVILTAATSHTGLSFNRSMLFLVNEKENRLEGKMGIGPDSAEDASTIWAHIEKNKIGLEELIGVETQFDHLKKSKLNQTIKSMKIPIREDSGVIALTVMEGMPFIINTPEAKQQLRSIFTSGLYSLLVYAESHYSVDIIGFIQRIKASAKKFYSRNIKEIALRFVQAILPQIRKILIPLSLVIFNAILILSIIHTSHLFFTPKVKVAPLILRC